MARPLPTMLTRRAWAVSTGVHVAAAVALVVLLHQDGNEQRPVRVTSALDVAPQTLEVVPLAPLPPFPDIPPPASDESEVRLPDWGAPTFSRDRVETPPKDAFVEFSGRLALVPQRRTRTASRTASQAPSTVAAEPKAAASLERGGNDAPSERTIPSAPVATELMQTPARDAATNRPPPYPALARTRGWTGVVLLAISVDSQGRAQTVTVKQSSGHAVLDQAARAAAVDWMFSPAKSDGRTVETIVLRRVRFTF